MQEMPLTKKGKRKSKKRTFFRGYKVYRRGIALKKVKMNKKAEQQEEEQDFLWIG